MPHEARTETMHTRQDLLDDLTALGVRSGDGLFVHASLRAVGQVEGGAAGLIGALFDAVGSDGLIGMPGFSTDAYFPPELDRSALSPEEIRQIEFDVPGFDLHRTPTVDMGILAETFRTWPGTLRSSDPSVSVCLNGPDAQQYIAPHPLAWASGGDGPFGHLRARPQMKILLIGVGWNRCTPLHTAESYAPHKRIKMRRYKSGPGASLWIETPDVADDLGRLFPDAGAAFEETGAVHQGKLGHALVRLCGYDALVEFATHWIDAANRESGDRH